jgi:hypothetical protein
VPSTRRYPGGRETHVHHSAVVELLEGFVTLLRVHFGWISVTVEDDRGMETLQMRAYNHTWYIAGHPLSALERVGKQINNAGTIAVAVVLSGWQI